MIIIMIIYDAVNLNVTVSLCKIWGSTNSICSGYNQLSTGAAVQEPCYQSSHILKVFDDPWVIKNLIVMDDKDKPQSLIEVKDNWTVLWK